MNQRSFFLIFNGETLPYNDHYIYTSNCMSYQKIQTQLKFTRSGFRQDILPLHNIRNMYVLHPLRHTKKNYLNGPSFSIYDIDLVTIVISTGWAFLRPYQYIILTLKGRIRKGLHIEFQ